MSFEPIYKSLGKFNPELVRVTASPDPEELKGAYARIEELEAALQEARLQIEYLHEKFQPTGTSEAVLARLDAVLG